MKFFFGMAAAAAALFATPAARAQDADAGQRVFNQCRACHTVEQNGRNGVGPSLHGVFGRTAGTLEGFRYSIPMRERGTGGLVWNEQTLRAYITAPREVVPAGTMAFVGLRNEQQLNDLIAYLRRATGAP